MQQPPLLPAEALARVVRLARFDGLGALILGGFFAVATAAAREVPFAVIGLLAAGAGAMELHGIALLREREARGMKWIIASQPFLLLVILAYCFLRAAHFELPEIPERVREMASLSAQQWNMTVEEYFRMINRVTALVLAVVATCYQGAMTVYYARRARAVARALVEVE